jgi:hypothetical protein
LDIRDLFEALGDHYVEKHGAGDPDAGWARLEEALIASESTQKP